MNKFFASAALVALALTAPAQARAPRITFTQDGVTYSYTETKVGDSVVYKGYATPGYDFYLVARGNQVVGKANGIAVSYTMPAAGVDIEGPVVVASR